MSTEHTPKRTKLTLHDFFSKRIGVQSSGTNSSPNVDVSSSPCTSQRVGVENVEMHTNVNSPYLEYDPGLRSSIWSYLVDIRDDVRKSFIKMSPCQPRLRKYPPIYYKGQKRHFQRFWFDQFPWLEYSEEKNSAFCFSCYLFDNCSSKYVTFTREGFQD